MSAGIPSCSAQHKTNFHPPPARLPREERPYAIGKVLAEPDYSCINGFPCSQGEDEFFLPPAEFEIDVTDIGLETPEGFHEERMGDCTYVYYNMDYGAFIALDLDKLEEYVTDYLEDQKN